MKKYFIFLLFVSCKSAENTSYEPQIAFNFWFLVTLLIYIYILREAIKNIEN